MPPHLQQFDLAGRRLVGSEAVAGLDGHHAHVLRLEDFEMDSQIADLGRLRIGSQVVAAIVLAQSRAQRFGSLLQAGFGDWQLDRAA